MFRLVHAEFQFSGAHQHLTAAQNSPTTSSSIQQTVAQLGQHGTATRALSAVFAPTSRAPSVRLQTACHIFSGCVQRMQSVSANLQNRLRPTHHGHQSWRVRQELSSRLHAPGNLISIGKNLQLTVAHQSVTTQSNFRQTRVSRGQRSQMVSVRRLSR